MHETLIQLNDRENMIIARDRFREANNGLNDLQREKIEAVYSEHGSAYLGKYNYSSDALRNLTPENVLTEYNGQRIYNFDYDFVIPVNNPEISSYFYDFAIYGGNMNVFENAYNRIIELGGANLFWT